MPEYETKGWQTRFYDVHGNAVWEGFLPFIPRAAEIVSLWNKEDADDPDHRILSVEYHQVGQRWEIWCDVSPWYPPKAH